MECVGSDATIAGGSIRQTIKLPTYRVRDEDFGITLTYDSGLAAARTLGGPPSDYEAVAHSSTAISTRPLRLEAICVPSATSAGGRSGVPAARQPGLCSAPGGFGCRLGQEAPISLEVARSWAGSTTSQSVIVGALNSEADFGAYLDVPLVDGKLAPPGLYTAHVSVDARTPGSCITAGVTFGVADESAPRIQLPLEPGPLASWDYHVLLNHRFASAFGAGWAVDGVSRVHRAGDVAFLVNGDGSEEKFAPRAYPRRVAPQPAAFKLGRDGRTGEIFVAREDGVIARFDPATGASTVVLSGLPFASRVRGLAMGYAGGARSFVVSTDTALLEVDAGGVLRTLASRTPTSDPFLEPSVAAKDDLVFYTDGLTAALYRVRLTDPTRAVEALSTVSDGDVRLYPRAPLSGVRFADPRGMDFGLDGALYLADVRRNAVYGIKPQANGEVGGASRVDLVAGDGTDGAFPPLGERYAGERLAIREPLGVTAAPDGTLFLITVFGAAAYDPRSREAEWLVFWAGIDELLDSPTALSVSAVGLDRSSFLIRNDNSGSIVRMDIDRASSEVDPTRTIRTLAGGDLELLDTTEGIVERFDAAGRLTHRRRRTGEPMMSVVYSDARSDKVAKIIDAVSGETLFNYGSSGKLESIVDARGRTTAVVVDASGDLASLTEPSGELHSFTYAAHRMTEKRSPRSDLTTYTHRPDGTLALVRQPSGATTAIDPALRNPPSFDADGTLVRTASYTDAHGVLHQTRVNSAGEIEQDTYVADGVTRVEQVIYASTIEDVLPTNPFGSAGLETRRKNKLLRQSHRTLNGIALGPRTTRYDGHYRPLIESWRSLLGRQWIYSDDGFLRAERDGERAGLNVGTAFTRDALGHVTMRYETNFAFVGGEVTYPATGQIEEMTYRPDGLLATETKHSVTKTFSYDDAGGTKNVTGWTDTLGRTMTFRHDSRGNVVESSDGTATTFATFDAKNRVVETRDALGNATTYGYSHAGCGCSQSSLVTSIHTPDLPAGVEWQMTYDENERLSSVTDPHGFTESYAYAPTGELERTRDKLLRDTSWTHDSLGRVLSMVDTLGRRHSNTYATPAGATATWQGPTLIAGSADASAPAPGLTAPLRAGDYQIGHNGTPDESYPPAVALYRDATFQLSFSRSFDSNKRVVTRFDRAGLPIDTTSPPGATAAFWSDTSSWSGRTSAPVLDATTSFRSGGGVENALFFRDTWLDSSAEDGFGASGEPRVTETLTRDAGGRITQRRRDFVGYGPSAPAASNVVSTYTYRPDGRVGQVVNPDGTHDFTYDSRGLVQTQTVQGEGTYTYGYDEMGRNSSLAYPDGHVRTQTFDDLGRITSRCYEYSGPTSRCYTAQYDAVGNPVRMTDPDGEDVFEFDALDRLMKVTRRAPIGGPIVAVEDYAYNALGALKVNAGAVLDDQRPRLAGGGTADAAVPASLGGLPIALNAGGFVTSLKGTALTWSQRGFLKEAQDPIPAALERYGHDAQLRRIARQGPAAAEFYVFEGLDRVATIAPGGTVLEGYLFDGIDHPLRMTRPATTTTLYYEVDLAGSVRELRASGGASVGGYRYSAFGRTIDDTATIDQPLRWKGRWYSPIAGGTYDVRARQWAPEAGVFLAVDEFQYHDAVGTLWGWPGMNPERYSDPSGRRGAGVAVGAAPIYGPAATLFIAPAWIFGTVALEAYGIYRGYKYLKDRAKKPGCTQPGEESGVYERCRYMTEDDNTCYYHCDSDGMIELGRKGPLGCNDVLYRHKGPL